MNAQIDRRAEEEEEEEDEIKRRAECMLSTNPCLDVPQQLRRLRLILIHVQENGEPVLVSRDHLMKETQQQGLTYFYSAQV